MRRRTLRASRPNPYVSSRLILLAAVIAAIAAVVFAATGHHLGSNAGDITYQVWGSPADVTWGPSGSTLQGSVPMKVTRTAGDASFYAVNAQLRGRGTVHCTISVGGRVISRADATAGYGIALCEISQDGGAWHSDSG